MRAIESRERRQLEKMSATSARLLYRTTYQSTTQRIAESFVPPDPFEDPTDLTPQMDT